ncbi:MAG: hypothetical protein IJV18_00830 [Acidaminococcaceae bacterium]|nr:hypothetical protein [Acidaminococcaceae bacterium]MBQ9284434.1 hypothetical protein [Acidaminococcaceae bacterium]MBR1511645.1 hypothetical protein [Acidaminococcaceae bacterium]
MNIKINDQLLKLLKEALELAQKLYRALQEGGPPPFSLLPEKAAIDRTTVHRKPADLFGLWDDEAIRREYLRMQTRNRVRRWRERERRKMNAVTEAGVTCNASVTDRNAPETATYETAQRPMESLFPAYDETTGVNECNAETVTCNASVTHCNAETVTGNAAAKKEKENEKRKNQRKEIKKNKKTKDETTNCAGESDKLIPTSKLPEAYRNVVTAWNRLPLEKKLKGLYPLLIRQLGNLFKQYGEETIHKAIDRVAESPFLLGQSKNSTGWVISLGWMLESEHLEKILKGQYTDRFGGSNARLFQPGDEATPFEDGFYGTVVY